jgi:hypothetical protein
LDRKHILEINDQIQLSDRLGVKLAVLRSVSDEEVDFLWGSGLGLPCPDIRPCFSMLVDQFYWFCTVIGGIKYRLYIDYIRIKHVILKVYVQLYHQDRELYGRVKCSAWSGEMLSMVG